MNKKPGLLFSVCALAFVILATVFKLHFPGANTESAKIAATDVANHLFVCPIADSTWDSVAKGLSILESYFSMFVVFAGIVLLFSWGWALYQNLLKDKFVVDAYKNPWDLTKAMFWIVVAFVIFIMTPNHFRAKITVRSNGQASEFVLCEQSSPNARAVRIRNAK